MSKELTDKWKNIKIKRVDGDDYISVPLSFFYNMNDLAFERSVELARLKEQLDIVTEQRDDIHIDKQVLQKQLNEANKIIKKLYKESGNPIGIDYLEKWGLK